LVLLLYGCLYRGAATDVVLEDAAARHVALLEGVPELRQLDEQGCGVTAVSALLAHHGLRASEDDVRTAVGVPWGTPVNAGALRDYLRQRGLDSYLIRGSLSDLRKEIGQGRPAIVGMLKPYVGDKWLAHYEVVVGYGEHEVVTMDPAFGFRSYPLPGFLREWAPTHFVLLVAARAKPQ
jgi:ABC-type bacteriocin/lantibiotic exporter with double-glycine peptidase domain